MVAMSEEVTALFKTLKNPRYATDENQGIAPIILDGFQNGKEIQFIASPQDVMEYGRELWKDASAGKYGPVGQFSPSLDELKQSLKMQCATTANLVSMVLADPARIGILETASTILARSNGKIPTEGPSVARLKQVAGMWKVPVEHLPHFITNVEDYRFAVVTTVAQLRVNADNAQSKNALKDALVNFEKELKKIIETFNFTNPPQKLVAPGPIKVPGL